MNSIFKRKGANNGKEAVPPAAQHDGQISDSDIGEKAGLDESPVTMFRMRIFVMALLVSLGGLIFGYDTGQISGFVAMDNFKRNFAEYQDGPGGRDNINNYVFSNSREGTIVGLLSIGTLVGCLIAGPLADATGRKISIVIWNIMFIIGVIVQIATTTKWYQIAIGRLIAGLGVGGLSVLTPMYQSETAPKQIRGALVCMYQLFITFGIFLASCINLGTNSIGAGGIENRASWRITIGIGFIFPAIFMGGIMFMRESPRWDYRKGNIDAARTTLAKSYGTSENHVMVVSEMREIQAKFDAETANGVQHPWYEIFTGPRMAYRTLLGITLQILQQLTGANFFFYYGTTVFQSVGLRDPYVTSLILGAVNFGCTFIGLYIVENFGRRKALITGGTFMFAFFMVFASVGHFVLQPSYPKDAQGVPITTTGEGDKTAGTVMIVFACLFILAYATTWGPIIWSVVPELYPSRYRSKSMGIATAGNWTFNFLISFFTPFITAAIDYRYGYIFAACNAAGVVIIYFFLIESQGRTLEEIDTAYIMHVKPWQSSSWQPPQGEEVGETDRTYLSRGGRDIQKVRENRESATAERQESVGEGSAGGKSEL